MPSKNMSRRGLFRSGGTALAAAGISATIPKAVLAAPARSLEVGDNLYQSIGVTPLVNCRGTYTIISGSQSLPEVKRAMEAASHSYVHLDELMDAVGQRLADITKAEWGMVTAGCAAALTHATSACIAGGDPEKMQRLPNLTGLKSEVVVPRYSRNEYDHAVRMLGVKMVEVDTAAEFEAAIGPQTAMVMILSCPAAEKGELSIPNACAIARRKGVPVIVDAAAETLTIPNIHLQQGANLVAYSGGKCMRGPQAAGLLLGQKDLIRAAWINSAPHHAFGRSVKVGKEEIMGMLAAVEMWVKRDHKAEWKQWEDWLGHIATSVKRVDGVTTKVNQPNEGLSNRTPSLQIAWDGAKLGITGQEVSKLVLDTEPRIVLASASGARGGSMASSVSVVPYQMSPGDEKVVAERLYALLSKPPRIDAPPPQPTPEPPANVSGQWEVRLDFVRGSANHTIVLEQDSGKLMGTHHGEFASGDLNGTVAANTVRFQSSYGTEGTRVSYQFTGKAEGGKMAGVVALGEYGEARWTAERHQYRAGGGRRG
jgi:uncharacterized pyridoxal phosphate-dependent enzyme